MEILIEDVDLEVAEAAAERDVPPPRRCSGRGNSSTECSFQARLMAANVASSEIPRQVHAAHLGAECSIEGADVESHSSQPVVVTFPAPFHFTARRALERIRIASLPCRRRQPSSTWDVDRKMRSASSSSVSWRAWFNQRVQGVGFEDAFSNVLLRILVERDSLHIVPGRTAGASEPAWISF